MNSISKKIELIGMNFREKIHPQLLKILSTKTTGELEEHGNLPDETCLIVANHLCIEDIPTLGQAVNEHFYLMVSDEDKKTLDGLGLSLNGVKWVHRTSKKSRNYVFYEAIDVLECNKHFAMYPEATWCLSPNLLVLPMNYGCIKIAYQANVPIIPVVTLFSKEKRITYIGEKYIPNNDFEACIVELRDRMGEMVYKEIEHFYKLNRDGNNIYSMMIDGEEYLFEKRENINPNYWQNHIDELYNAYPRAKKDKEGVRNFESQFIFTPKTDDYSYFQIFNSSIKYDENGNRLIKRISSEKGGYMGTGDDLKDYRTFFEYGYNEKVLSDQLKELESLKRVKKL